MILNFQGIIEVYYEISYKNRPKNIADDYSTPIKTPNFVEMGQYFHHLLYFWVCFCN
jgi:hypothetical protein